MSTSEQARKQSAAAVLATLHPGHPTISDGRQLTSYDMRLTDGFKDAEVSASPKFTGSLANQVCAKALASGSAEWHWLFGQIAGAARLTLSPEVLRGSLQRTLDIEELRPALALGVRLPHQPCFIEYPAAAMDEIVGIGSANGMNKHGILFWSDADCDVRARAVLATEIGPIYVPALAIYGSADIGGQTLEKHLAPEVERSFTKTAVLFAWMGLRILTMLTAKNSPLVIEKEEDFSALNKHRSAKGRHRLLGSMPVRWNLSRVERRRHGAGKPLTEAGRSEAIAHLVRGHLKVRKNGVFWWSPHVRLTADEIPPKGRDYIVKAD